MKLFLIYIGFLLLYSSCTQVSKNNFTDKNGYYEIRGDDGIPDYIKYYTKDGKLNGGAISFMENGNVRSFTYLLNDSVVSGPSVRYYDNGKLNYYTSFIEGKKEGVSVHYSPKGILTKKLYFRNGVKDGKQYIFDYDTGDTLKIETYQNGKLIE